MYVFLGTLVTDALQQRLIQMIIEAKNRENQDLPLTVRGCKHPIKKQGAFLPRMR